MAHGDKVFRTILRPSLSQFERLWWASRKTYV